MKRVVSSDRPETGSTPYVSVVVPLYNESANVGALGDWILEALADSRDEFEVILVDDGSSDDTWDRICEAAEHPEIRGIRLAGNVGQTAAMMAGFDHAQGKVLVSLDGDLQNDPGDIPMLVSKLSEGYDLVCGWRQNRQDQFLLRRVPSWCANRLIALLTGVPIKDNGCSLKAYRRGLLSRVRLYAEQHRFIPALAASSGARIAQLPVRHHARRFGKSKYGLSRTFKVLVDLLTLKMVTTFRTRPLVGFGIGTIFAFAVGLLFALMWVVAFTGFGPEKANALVLPGAALLCFGLAFYLLMIGLIAEFALRADGDAAWHAPVAREVP
jgi:glycosyltransferase involved in cell wall biosynthesis